MKFNKFFKVIAAIAVMPMFFSCGAPKAVTSDLKEVSVPLSSKEYRSDANFFRATGIGESPDLVTAKKIATLNARTEIASSIQSTIKAVSEQYLNQVTVGNKQEFAAKFEETSRQVVNQVLEGVVVKEEKVFQSKEGKYQYYINVEILSGFYYEVNVFGHTVTIVRQAFALLALLPIWLYRGKQGPYNKVIKYVYYWFYPTHLLVLGLVKLL